MRNIMFPQNYEIKKLAESQVIVVSIQAHRVTKNF